MPLAVPGWLPAEKRHPPPCLYLYDSIQLAAAPLKDAFAAPSFRDLTWPELSVALAIVLLAVASLFNGIKARYHWLWEGLLLTVGVTLAWSCAYLMRDKFLIALSTVVPMVIAYISGRSCREEETPKSRSE